jgi:putative FmdB family regulatory protein
MPILDFKCSSCGFTDEFIVGSTIESDLPEKCPKCGKGKMEKQVSFGNQSFNIKGYCYDNVYGKKKGLDKYKQADKLLE